MYTIVSGKVSCDSEWPRASNSLKAKGYLLLLVLLLPSLEGGITGVRYHIQNHAWVCGSDDGAHAL